MTFTPILPYSATDYDTVHTVNFNSQDVLMQKIKNMEHYGEKKILKYC